MNTAGTIGLVGVIVALAGMNPEQAALPVAQPDFSIAAAVAVAAPGDTVRVPAGVYIEPTVLIDRPIVLIGEGEPVWDGGGTHGMFLVTADSVSISGFVFRNTGITFMDDRAAVRFEGTAGCRVFDNRFEKTFFALYLAGVHGCHVHDNVFEATADRESNGGNAVHSWYSSHLLIERNTISGHRDGIYLEFTEDSRVLNNHSHDNTRYGLHFMFSDRCVYEDNTFERNGAGVAVMYADDVEMRRNRFLDAWGASAYGLLLKEIKDGAIEDNTFSGNSVALLIEGTDRLAFVGNRFRDNGWAIKLMANAISNHFEGNVFTGNTFDISTNSRSSSSTFKGNYWDRYRGYDLDRDGTGDVAFLPVRLFSIIVERNEPALVLLRSPLVDLLDAVERVLPVLTPASLFDSAPLMAPPAS